MLQFSGLILFKLRFITDLCVLEIIINYFNLLFSNIFIFKLTNTAVCGYESKIINKQIKFVYLYVFLINTQLNMLQEILTLHKWKARLSFLKRNMHSKFRWFSVINKFCNSHHLTYFATFFIVMRAKISIVETIYYILVFWLFFILFIFIIIKLTYKLVSLF